MQVIFLGLPVPIDYIDEHDSYCHFAKSGAIAQLNLLRGLTQHKNIYLSVITASPTNKRSSLQLTPDITAHAVSNLHTKSFGLWLLSLIPFNTSALFRQIKTLRRATRHEPIMIMTLNTFLPFSLPVLWARLFFRHLIWCPFLVDAVEAPNYKFPFTLASKLGAFLARFASGAVTLALPNAIDYFPHKPFLETFFVLDNNDIEQYQRVNASQNKKFTITFTGAFISSYNLDVVLQVIKNTGKKYAWVFAGYGPYEPEIKKLSRDKNYDVSYLGNLTHNQAIAVQKSADLLLCKKGGVHSRINAYYAKYAASGKLSEYLYTGKPILASDIPAFSPQLKKYTTLLTSTSAAEMQCAIADITKNYPAKLKIARAGQKFAFANLTIKKQGERVSEFLEKLMTEN